VSKEKQAYLNGVQDTLTEVNNRLNASIKRNGGARTASDVVNVFNDVVTNLHMMELEYRDSVVEVDKSKEEENVIIVFTNLGGVVQ
jgi:predicted translin family RNA/ssDNA-binding protein